MHTLKLILLLICVTIVMNKDDFSSEEYLKLSAKSKMNQLWEKISENQNSLDWYSKLTVLKIFLSDLWVSFREKGDVFPEGRQKLIHTVGNIAKAEFIPEEITPYTGIFRGSTNMLLRFSVAKKPDITKSTPEQGMYNFVPGMAMKFLRDGVQSGNLVAMYSTNGQASWNPFKNDFTNVFDMGGESTDLLVLAAKFQTVTSMISSIGVRDLAQYDQFGNIETNPRYPFKLIFRPNKEITEMFPDSYQENYTEQLKKISPGTVLYEVFAIDEPGCNPSKIGSIKITTQLITSKFADEKLFFRHGLIDEDDNEEVDWSDYRDSFKIFGGVTKGKEPTKKSGCPFSKLFG